MKTKTPHKNDKLKLVPSSRHYDKKKMLSAAKKQEEIKKKYGMPEKGWSSFSELRKWRDSH